MGGSCKCSLKPVQWNENSLGDLVKEKHGSCSTQRDSKCCTRRMMLWLDPAMLRDVLRNIHDILTYSHDIPMIKMIFDMNHDQNDQISWYSHESKWSKWSQYISWKMIFPWSKWCFHSWSLCLDAQCSIPGIWMIIRLHHLPHLLCGRAELTMPFLLFLRFKKYRAPKTSRATETRTPIQSYGFIPHNPVVKNLRSLLDIWKMIFPWDSHHIRHLPSLSSSPSSSQSSFYIPWYSHSADSHLPMYVHDISMIWSFLEIAVAPVLAHVIFGFSHISHPFCHHLSTPINHRLTID